MTYGVSSIRMVLESGFLIGLLTVKVAYREVKNTLQVTLKLRLTLVLSFGSPAMPNYILSHTSSFKSAWTWFILMLTLYTAWMVPYSVAFQVRSVSKQPFIELSIQTLDKFTQ